MAHAKQLVIDGRFLPGYAIATTMLRIIQNRSAGSAKSYYSRADYLSEAQEQAGLWRGNGAVLLGLRGLVHKKDFDALCDNLNPVTGEQLTARQRADRTVGYDFNFNLPKGISIAYALNQDERILEAFRTSVHETMQDVEKDALTRVRKNGAELNRPVGNLLWAEFIHKTARPVQGVPDPNLHAHCFVMNSVYDPVEKIWKAGQFREIKRDAPYYEAVFESKLALKLQSLGYSIVRKGKSWDIGEIHPNISAKFSRRTDQIEELARKKGISLDSDKDGLAAKSRESKSSDLTMDQLRDIWRERLTDEESSSLQSVRPERLTGKELTLSENEAAKAVEFSLDHLFERASVNGQREILALALKQGVGEVSLDSVLKSYRKTHPIEREFQGRTMVTTPEVLAEERQMVDYCFDTQYSEQPLNSDWQLKRDWLNQDQKRAVYQLVNGTDRVLAVRGGAGTGKTTLMHETIEAIKQGGHEVFTFAPSAAASRDVLQKEGFESTTVAELLVNKEWQSRIQDQIIWVDEAGLLSSRVMHRLLNLAKTSNARVILSGDWRQHSSPERGSALKILEEQQAIRPAIVGAIERQKGEYRELVARMAVGDIESGFDRLNELGWIKAIEDDDDRNSAIAKEYSNLIARGQSALVVAPTHAECDLITSAIRSELLTRQLIDSQEHSVTQLIPLHFTAAEKSDVHRLEEGLFAVFHQNVKGFNRGKRVKITSGNREALAHSSKHFELFRESSIAIAKGDLVRITHNGMTSDGKHRLNNGNVYRVKAVDETGRIQLENGWQLAADFGHLASGYASTSHSSQGKTVDHVLIAESSVSLPAASPEQFYVSVSRGRKQATVFTDNVDSLKAAVLHPHLRHSALALVSNTGSSPKSIKRRRLIARNQQQMNRDTIKENQFEVEHGRQ